MWYNITHNNNYNSNYQINKNPRTLQGSEED